MITPPTSILPPLRTPVKSTMMFDTIDGQMNTEVHLAHCAKMFSENYGIWGQRASAPLKAGEMTAKKLRQQCLDNPYKTILAMAWENNKLVGHAFATKWKYEDRYVGWVMQLVVDNNSHLQGIASMLLRHFSKTQWGMDVKFMGLVSSHPGACNTLCNVYNIRPKEINTMVITKHAAAVVACTNIDYLKNIEFRGSLFQQDTPPETVSLVYMSFWVNHTEPLLALGFYKQCKEWVLGDLLDGHEYFILVPAVERPVVPIEATPDLFR
ncbi:hypothetical protein C8Q80DRAFT_1099176 [Daedaleopsis nitida]|nr:hypothetical protein C8Q80DRAFT_1099176 [Daedaleopsis nitida]